MNEDGTSALLAHELRELYKRVQEGTVNVAELEAAARSTLLPGGGGGGGGGAAAGEMFARQRKRAARGPALASGCLGPDARLVPLERHAAAARVRLRALRGQLCV